MVPLGFGRGGGVGSKLELLGGGFLAEGGVLVEGEGEDQGASAVAVAVAGIGAQCAAEDGAVPHCCALGWIPAARPQLCRKLSQSVGK